MLHETPLRPQHEAYVRAALENQASRRIEPAARPGAAIGHQIAAPEIETIAYGVADENGRPTCELVASFGSVELEYAAIRRGAGLFDSPHRGTLHITGNAAERRDFLNRMVTQEMKDLAPGDARQAFWLNRKGRVDADLLLIEFGARMLIDLDIHQASSTVKSLGEFLFAEDIVIRDASSEFHHVAVHGQRAGEVIAAASGATAFDLPPLKAIEVTIDGVGVVVARRDQVGAPGFELIMQANDAPRVWEFLLAADHIVSQDRRRVRPIGWHAFNIARIEAGTPIFNVDFGRTNLPHETGILRERVSFTKGCYLGQEIVARMESLGKPKQALVGLKMQRDLLPVAGAQVFARAADGLMDVEIGQVTSSTLSPMLGSAPIAFAMLKTSHAASGTIVLVNAEGQQCEAAVSPLRFVD